MRGDSIGEALTVHQPSNTFQQLLNLRAGSVEGLDPEAGPVVVRLVAGKLVSGHVVDDGGDGGIGLRLQLVPVERPWWYRGIEHEAWTDETGSFRFVGPAPGDVDVRPLFSSCLSKTRESAEQKDMQNRSAAAVTHENTPPPGFGTSPHPGARDADLVAAVSDRVGHEHLLRSEPSGDPAIPRMPAPAVDTDGRSRDPRKEAGPSVPARASTPRPG